MTRSTRSVRAGALAVVLTAAMVLAACAGEDSPTEPDEDETGGEASETGGEASETRAMDEEADISEFNIAWNAQPPTLDPMATTAGATFSLGRNIFEPLLTWDLDNELQPVLAESWELLDGGATVVFTLRDDVVFHNGDPMTAEDVAASLNRWIRLSSVGQEFFEGAEAEVSGELEVTLTTPEAMFPTLMMLGDVSAPAAIMPASVIEEAPDEGTDEIVGTGPYRLVEWATDQYVHLELNEDYAPAPGEPSGMAGDRTGTYENIYYRLVPDSSTRISGMQSGQYDAAVQIPYDNFDQVENDPGLQASVINSGFAGVVFNKAEGLMADVTMRQAVNAALDLEEIQMAAFSDERFYSMNGSIMEPESLWYTEAGLENYNVADPDLAADLLDEAGYDGEPIRIVTTREYEEYYHAAVVMEQQMSAVGMEVELVVVDWATVLELRSDPAAHEISVTAWGVVPIPTRYVFLYPDWSGWTDDPAISEAIDDITYAEDEDSALEAADALQEALYDYLPIIKFGDRTNITVVREGIADFEPPPGVGDLFFRVYPTE